MGTIRFAGFQKLIISSLLAVVQWRRSEDEISKRRTEVKMSVRLEIIVKGEIEGEYDCRWE